MAVNQSDFLRAVAAKLNDEIAHMSEDLARGTAPDFGAYKYACGIVRGLMIANGQLREMADKMEDDDD